MENLIYDRTQADVDAGLDKARASVDFLNRIESWCAYLAEVKRVRICNCNEYTKKNVDDVRLSLSF